MEKNIIEADRINSIVLVAHGDVTTIDNLIEKRDKAIKVALEMKFNKMLVDMREVNKKYCNIQDDKFAEKLFSGYFLILKIAVVFNRHNFNDSDLSCIEAMHINRGVNLKPFVKYGEAFSWLIND